MVTATNHRSRFGVLVCAIGVLCLAIQFNSLRIADFVSRTNYLQSLTFLSHHQQESQPSNEDQQRDQHKPIQNLLLTVPFYVYEDLVWTNVTYHTNVSFTNLRGRDGGRYKHSEDYWFMLAALRHPMRTRDPTLAKLFVVPILMNLYSRRWARIWAPHVDFTMCNQNVCDDDLLQQVYQTLSSSKWFRRNDGRDHIVVSSHFGYDEAEYQGRTKVPKKIRKLLARCNMITFESRRFNDVDRFFYPSYYVGFPCPHAKEKLYDFAMVATLKPKLKTFQDRQHVCDWIHHGLLNSTMAICGGGDQCPILAQSKFGFHVRGDTFGSSRLMDILLSGTVPIFTRRQQYTVLPAWIDWDQLSYFVNVSDKEPFLSSLQGILQDRDGYQRRYDAVLTHQPLFDWETLYPFDTYMYMLQHDLYSTATTLGNHRRFSALRLPQSEVS